MRYYSLTIQNSAGQVLQIERSGLGFTWSDASQGATFSSVYTPYQISQRAGQPNPSALNIEFDLPVAPLHIPQGGSYIRVWGLGLRCLSAAANLNPVNGVFKTFTLRGGMSAGLPLANPAQAGLIATGIIYQAFGSWQGTEQTLDMIVQAGDNSGVPIAWSWKRGTTLQSALAQMFRQAFPTYKPNINIAESLIAPSDQTGIYTNITAFAKNLYSNTRRLGAQANGTDYQGVGIITIGNSIYASDGAGSAPPKTVPLAFQDFVGQPTWIEANTILFQTVLRGDINYNDKVTFPTGTLLPYALTAPAAAYPNSPAASNIAFQGSFLCNQDIHHYGNYIQPEAVSWNTTFRATYIPKP